MTQRALEPFGLSQEDLGLSSESAAGDSQTWEGQTRLLPTSPPLPLLCPPPSELLHHLGLAGRVCSMLSPLPGGAPPLADQTLPLPAPLPHRDRDPHHPVQEARTVSFLTAFPPQT